MDRVTKSTNVEPSKVESLELRKVEALENIADTLEMILTAIRS